MDIRDLQDSGSRWFRQVQVRVNDIFCHFCSTLFFPPSAVLTVALWAGHTSELPPLSDLQEEVLDSSGHTSTSSEKRSFFLLHLLMAQGFMSVT